MINNVCIGIKKTISGQILCLAIILVGYGVIQSPHVYANAPTFEANYISHLMKNGDNPNGNETLRDLKNIGIDKNVSLMDNIKNIFYPDSSGQGGRLRDILKVLGLIVFVVMITRQGFQYTLQSDDESKVAGFHTNFAYIFLGGILFFGATWILGIGLNVGGDGGSNELINKLDTSILFQIFSGLRTAAFFIAVILLGFTGWKIMSAMDDDSKLKAGKQGILNIIISLIVIKVIDYTYYIAQTPDFKGKATELIVEMSKVLGYILGGFFTISLIYYGFALMFGGGSDESLKKVKSVITAVFLGTLVLFIFLLIIYQISQEFI